MTLDLAHLARLRDAVRAEDKYINSCRGVGFQIESASQPANAAYYAALRNAADELIALAGRAERYEKFVLWAMESVRDGCDVDGGDAQDKAVELGILVGVQVTEACGDSDAECNCAEFGFPMTCYRLATPDPGTPGGET